MSFFNTTSTLTHRTPLPPPITRASALALFRNHDFMINLDPELVSYTEEKPKDPAANTKYYSITDHMDTLPRAIYDAKVSFKCEITDVDDGMMWVVKAPLGLVQTSHWRLDEEEEGGEKQLVLIEDVHLSCSRLLMGTVRGKCNENWESIHGKFAGKLKSDAESKTADGNGTEKLDATNDADRVEAPMVETTQ